MNEHIVVGSAVDYQIGSPAKLPLLVREIWKGSRYRDCSHMGRRLVEMGSECLRFPLFKIGEGRSVTSKVASLERIVIDDQKIANASTSQELCDD